MKDRPNRGAHLRMQSVASSGYVLLGDYRGPLIPRAEWESLEYVDWKSGGDTSFAILASANGDMDAGGFWNHGKPDKDGVWTRNGERCPTLVRYVESVGARFGRVRVIRLNPSDLQSALKHLHQDDNNRLNPEGEGWVVRSWLELHDPPGSTFILRREHDEPGTEARLPLHPGRQLVIDTERLWHVVYNPGPGPRYALIVSWESGPALEAWMRDTLVAGARIPSAGSLPERGT